MDQADIRNAIEFLQSKGFIVTQSSTPGRYQVNDSELAPVDLIALAIEQAIK
jgi:hypothetical protein